MSFVHNLFIDFILQELHFGQHKIILMKIIGQLLYLLYPYISIHQSNWVNHLQRGRKMHSTSSIQTDTNTLHEQDTCRLVQQLQIKKNSHKKFMQFHASCHQASKQGETDSYAKLHHTGHH